MVKNRLQVDYSKILKPPRIVLSAERRPPGRPPNPKAAAVPAPLKTTVRWSGRPVALTPLEAQLYHVLKTHAPDLVPVFSLMSRVWQTPDRSALPEVGALHFLVNRIRKKLPGFAETVFAEGYRWKDADPWCWMGVPKTLPKKKDRPPGKRGPVTVPPAVAWAGRRVVLDGVEARLVFFLKRADGKMVTLTRLKENVWGKKTKPEDAAVYRLLEAIREKLPGFGEECETSHARGLRWVKPDPWCWLKR